VYDGFQRKCKTIEPETASTIQQHDNAGNVVWRASGQALPSTSCDTSSVALNKKISYAYDVRNRLTTTSYGDGSPPITRTYTPDGLAATISSGGAVWTNTYNQRRLNELESLAYGGAIYNIGRAYDANGSLSQLKYPDNSTVSYLPNALGEATQVGTYARNIAYHPNGAAASFSYGNGIAHSLVLNARQLPRLSTDSGVLNDKYDYDANGNVLAITDLLAPGTTSRSMAYDNLDRLKTVSAPNLFTSSAPRNTATTRSTT
jgi:hypothetical protein